MSRREWDDVWWDVALAVASRSRCDGRQIGAVIIAPGNRPVAVGYNGPPAGFPVADGQTCQSFCPRRQTGNQTQGYGNCISVHAEANALMFADRREYVGGTLYVTSAPCWDCGKMVANSGIDRVVTFVDEIADAHRKPDLTIHMMEQSGLEVVHYA
jgi:dCMP deaminase